MIVLCNSSVPVTSDTQVTIQLLQFPHRPKDKFEVRIMTENGSGIQKNTKRFGNFQAAKQAYKVAAAAWGA